MDDQPRRPETTAEKASPENAKAIAAKILAEHEAKTAADPPSQCSGVPRTAAATAEKGKEHCAQRHGYN